MAHVALNKKGSPTSKAYRNRQRLTQSQKNSNDYQWYKDQADLLDKFAFSRDTATFGMDRRSKKKVNYDLFNNIIDMKDFAYVCQPFGEDVGELPANLTNRDIVSGKIKVLLGMEMKMPFSWKVVAVNEEATTRKEEEEFNQIKEFVTNQVMKPIRMEIEQQLAAQNKGRELTPEEQQQVQQQVEEATQSRTPDQVRKYMAREHQDPAEMLAHQLLEYLILKEKIPHKFNKGWKHSLLSGGEYYYVGIRNGEPCVRVVNSLNFDHDMSPDLDFVEDGEWAVCDYWMTPSDIVKNFGEYLTEKQIDDIYERGIETGSAIRAEDFTFNEGMDDSPYTLRVAHFTFKSLRKIGFLTYLDEDKQEQMMPVNETYVMNEGEGDIDIDWQWIPEVHEVYKILDDIYICCRPVPGQHKDMDNLYDAKLPYIGASVDNLNSPITCAMDRVRYYQYYFDIVLYRVELLMASDKGKILAANIGAIPKSAGIDTTKFMYFMEANKIAWFNTSEEGNRAGTEVTNLVKEIDMSLASDIAKYIEIAEYIERKCGDAIGVTKQMEGAIGPNDAVSNTRQNLIQSSHIIQPYFELHNTVKGNVLTALLETAKVAYSGGKKRKLSYVLDDMSVHMLTIDTELLPNSSYGLFVSNSSKAADAKQAVESLSQAAMQNQQADLADIIKVIRSESIVEAEELLEAAKSRKMDQEQSMEKQKLQAQKEMESKMEAREERQRQHEKEMIILKEEEERKTELQKQTILSMGFDPEKDRDKDSIPDILEVYRAGKDADIKERKLNLEERKEDRQAKMDEQKIELEKKKLAQEKNNKPKS